MSPASLLPLALLAGAAEPAPAADPPVVPSPPAVPVDPDTLVVPPPETPEPRKPDEDIARLLRAELSMLEAAQDLDMAILRRETELARLEAQEEVVVADLARTEERFAASTADLDRLRVQVRRRLRAMVQLERTEPYQVLFASESHATFLRRIRALSTLLDADRRRIADYRLQLETWRHSKEDLERRRRNLARTRETAANLLQEVTWDRSEKEALLVAVRERAAFHAKLAQEMETVDVELGAKVQELVDPNRPRLWIEETKGSLQLPIRNGRITGRFGTRVHPRFGTKTIHRGLDVAPEQGGGEEPVRVRSMYWGYVAYTGWLRGLGKVVLVDHTRGYLSLYAHLAEIHVEVGEKVKTGQAIGIMGDTGSLRGPGLYVELRKDGKAIDPEPWLQ